MSDLHLTGWAISCPKSPYLRRPLKTRRDLRESSGCIPEQDFAVASYHFNIIKPEIGQRLLYLDMVQDDHLTHNSIIEDCLYGDTLRLNLHRYTSKCDCLTPVKPLSFSMHSKIKFFLLLFDRTEKLKLAYRTSKKYLLFAAIKAIH